METDKVLEEVKKVVKKEKPTFILNVQKSHERPYIFLYMNGSNHLDYEFKDGEWVIHLDLNFGHRKELGKIKSYKDVKYNKEVLKEVPDPIKNFIEKVNKVFKETLKPDSVKFITSMVRRRMLASSVMIKPFSTSLFAKIEVPMQHRAPHEDYGDREEWVDTDYNYRLDSPVEEIYYAFTKSKVIGHLGLNSEDKIIAVYVDPEFRKKGVSTKLHEEVFKRSVEVLSDDPSAMEPEEKATWEKLMKKLPKEIKKLKDGSYIYKA